MSIILRLLVLGICVSMFILKREYKIAAFLAYAICLQQVNFNLFDLGINLGVPTFFFLSELPHYRRYLNYLKKNVVGLLMALMLFATIVLWVVSVHLSGVKGLFSIIHSQLIIKYFVLIYSILSVYSIKTMRPVIVSAIVALSVLTSFGVLNLVDRSAIFVNWAMEGVDTNNVNALMGEKFQNSERFRVQAMHFNPFDYGFMCSALSLFFLYCYKMKWVSSFIFYMMEAGCFFGVISCNCRTVLFSCIIAWAFFYAVFSGAKRWIGYMAVGTFVIVLLYVFFPFFASHFTYLMSVFDSGSDIQGSSIAMRMMQIAGVFDHIKDDLIFGRGYHYFHVDMGWSEGSEGLVDWRLAGLEGVYLNLLLERGFFGLIIYLIFWGG